MIEFMKHMDNFEMYPNLSEPPSFIIDMNYSSPIGEFLMNNYHQALDTVKGEWVLKKTMADLRVIDVSVFVVWLVEEQDYLKRLSREPLWETQEMEYYQKLVNLGASK